MIPSGDPGSVLVPSWCPGSSPTGQAKPCWGSVWDLEDTHPCGRLRARSRLAVPSALAWSVRRTRFCLPARMGTPVARLNGSVRKVERRVCQSRLVVNKVVPCTASTSFRSVSVNPTLASTLREAVFQSQTVAHRRSYPDDRAHSRTANEASVAYP